MDCALMKGAYDLCFLGDCINGVPPGLGYSGCTPLLFCTGASCACLRIGPFSLQMQETRKTCLNFFTLPSKFLSEPSSCNWGLLCLTLT